MEDINSNKHEVSLGRSEYLKKENEILGNLDEHKKGLALKLSKDLDFEDELSIKAFGSNLEQRLGSNAEEILENTKINDADEIGVLLNDLMYNIQQTKGDNPSDKVQNKFLKRIFKKAEKTQFDLKTSYTNVKGRIEEIKSELVSHEKRLNNDIAIIQDMIDKNQQLVIASDIYIKAGELKIAELKTMIIPELIQQVEEKPNTEVEIELMDMKNYLERLEKRLGDLALTNKVLQQSTPQLNLMKNANYILSDKISSSIQSVIPLWQQQISIATSLKNQAVAIEIQKSVSDLTNDMVLQNSELLKTNTINTAKANEEGILRVDVLEKVQENLIETIRETIQIQEQGAIDRENAKARLAQMDVDLRARLLEMSQGTSKGSQGRKMAQDATLSLEHNESRNVGGKKKESFEEYL